MLTCLSLGPLPEDVRAGVSVDVPPEVHFWLTVLHNNDGESQLIDLGGGLEDFGGVARFATLVASLKEEATRGPRPGFPPKGSGNITPGGKRGVLMVSSGDNFLAGPEFNARVRLDSRYRGRVGHKPWALAPAGRATGGRDVGTSFETGSIDHR